MMNNFKSGIMRVPVARPVNTAILKGHYNGKELRPYEGRPGANDAALMYAEHSRGYGMATKRL